MYLFSFNPSMISGYWLVPICKYIILPKTIKVYLFHYAGEQYLFYLLTSIEKWSLLGMQNDL